MIYMNYYSNIMKRILYAAVIVMLAAITGASAQGQRMGQGQGLGQADNERLTAYKIAFFTQRLDLTPAEAEKFWPLYNKFSDDKSSLQAERLSLMRNASQNESKMSEAELSAAADRLVQTYADEATLVSSFNRDLRKVLPPLKVIRLFQIENLYKQQLLRELNQRRQGQTGVQPGRGRFNQSESPDL
jgi:hypothetical protein